jgi:hypothetical protein
MPKTLAEIMQEKELEEVTVIVNGEEHVLRQARVLPMSPRQRDQQPQPDSDGEQA